LPQPTTTEPVNATGNPVENSITEPVVITEEPQGNISTEPTVATGNPFSIYNGDPLITNPTAGYGFGEHTQVPNAVELTSPRFIIIPLKSFKAKLLH
jgi:hypothetical protein